MTLVLPNNLPVSQRKQISSQCQEKAVNWTKGKVAEETKRRVV